MRPTVLFAALLFSATCAHASCDCFDEAGRQYRLNPDVLRAIAHTESRMNPLAVNVQGRSVHPKSLQEAIAHTSVYKGRSFDVGIMQINSQWFRRLGIDPAYGFDACYNIKLGAYILRRTLDEHGYSWAGLGRYHSPTQWRAAGYAGKVYANFRAILQYRYRKEIASGKRSERNS